MSIEIPQNTLLKLLIRSGSDSERRNIILSRGELGYTLDTKRLYVGDGTTYGGTLVGNLFQGSGNDITAFAPSQIGDYAFNTDTNKLYRLQSNDGSAINDWQLIGGVYSSGNGISIDASNVISTSPLSAGGISQDSITTPIIFDVNSRLSLSATVPLDGIRLKTANSLEFPGKITVNSTTFTMPSSAPLGGILQTNDLNGTLICAPLGLSSISLKTITVTNGLTAIGNGLDITGTAVNPLSTNIIIGVSPSLSSYNLNARYNGNTDTLVYTKGITSVTKLGVGNYQFNFPSTPGNMYPSTQIFGLSSITYQARVTSLTNTACIINVVNASLTYGDVELVLKIST
jgi:hypothetical protein